MSQQLLDEMPLNLLQAFVVFGGISHVADPVLCFSCSKMPVMSAQCYWYSFLCCFAYNKLVYFGTCHVLRHLIAVTMRSRHVAFHDPWQLWLWMQMSAVHLHTWPPDTIDSVGSECHVNSTLCRLLPARNMKIKHREIYQKYNPMLLNKIHCNVVSSDMKQNWQILIVLK